MAGSVASEQPSVAARQWWRWPVGTLAIAAGLAAATVGVLLVVPAASPEPDQKALPAPVRDTHPDLPLPAPLREAVAAQVAAEARNAYRPPTAIAPPDVEFAREPATTPAPAPPDGFAYTPEPVPLLRRALDRSKEPPQQEVGDAEPRWPWLHESDAIAALTVNATAAGRDWTFGWLALADAAPLGELQAALARQGVEVFGTAGSLLRARLPADPVRLAAIAALPAVAGVGALPPAHKVAASLKRSVAAAPYVVQPAFVTLMPSDGDGRWREALVRLGATVGRYEPALRTYIATVDAAALDAIAQADFVLAVAPVNPVRQAHDTAVPAMGADALRQHSTAPGLFTGMGGASVPVGVLDTGLNTRHMDIASGRASICGANFATLPGSAEDDDLWHDARGHGTHVTGTAAGSGHYLPRYAGMAPLVRHIRFAKVLNRTGRGVTDWIHRGMDFMAEASRCHTPAGRTSAAKPLIVNVSLAAVHRLWDGRNVDARKLDAVVWNARQLYVVAHANADVRGFANLAAAKNALPVGATGDDGQVASFSSVGPTADGRLSPLIVGTGVSVYSAQGGGALTGYVRNSGTSMASPAVAGVAALLLDHSRGHRNQPALTRARLLASAIRVDAWLAVPDAFPANNSNGPGELQHRYGLGKASARTSVLMRNQPDGWTNGGSTATVAADEYSYRDINVRPGTSRLDVVLTWDEPPAEAIGSTVLNDFDLYLDHRRDCEAAACGEHVSRSRKDNVEWIFLKNPSPGRYRIKAVPHRVYTAPPRVALAWTAVRGASAPTLELEAELSAGGDEVVVTVSADAYVAAGVRLLISCRDTDGDCAGEATGQATITTEDGEWPMAYDKGASLALGEVAVGERQQVRINIDTKLPSRIYFVATGWNANPGIASIAVDGEVGAAPAAAERPANDDLADATTLDGASGQQSLDLLLATPEPGEPAYTAQYGRASGSVWFRWQAVSDGAVHFGLQSGDAPSADARIDVFQGDHPAGLVLVAGGELGGARGASHFATAGEEYLIRVSYGSDSPYRMTLHWAQGPRPANDDLAAALALAGADGEVAGHNLGATLEPGEQFGNLASTVWYSWQASAGGDQFFRTNAGSLMVFQGDDIGSLRLVSDGPNRYAAVPVRAGERYLVAVAAGSGNASGSHFTLTWGDTEREARNDDFSGAEDLSGNNGSVWARTGGSVEPGEPLASGVRTRWWTWVAPATGNFTFRLAGPSNPALQLAVFGTAADVPTFADLRLIASTKERTTTKILTLPAVANNRYWLAFGWPVGDRAAFVYANGQATLEWAPAPANDALADAALLAGASGSRAVSLRDATVEEAERTDVLGHSSLWWRYRAPAAGWWRFRAGNAEGYTLTAYRRNGPGFAGLEQVATTERGWHAADDVGVLFQASPEEIYVIRLGWRETSPAPDTTLHWEAGEPPVWLRYAGRLAGAALGLDGDDALASLVFDERGTTGYLSTSLGLQALRRDAASGALAAGRQVAAAADSLLAWDAGRTRLWAKERCDDGDWRRFAPTAGSRRQLRDEGVFEVRPAATPQTDCAEEVFLDAAGRYLTVRRPSGIDVLAVAGQPAGTLAAVETVEGPSNAAAFVPDGTRLYLLSDTALKVLARDPDTGMLTTLGETQTAGRAQALAVAAEGTPVFVVDVAGATTAYSILPGEGAPQRLAHLPAFGDASYFRHVQPCAATVARTGQPALAAFCRDSAFTVRWRGGDVPALEATDYVAAWQPDRFDNAVPTFRPRFVTPSPDGRHLYVGARRDHEVTPDLPDDLLIFERVGHSSAAPAATGTVDLARR